VIWWRVKVITRLRLGKPSLPTRHLSDKLLIAGDPARVVSQCLDAMLTEEKTQFGMSLDVAHVVETARS
jgi:hypothetical protein